MTETVWVTIITSLCTIVVNLVTILPKIKDGNKAANESVTAVATEVKSMRNDFEAFKADDDDRFAESVRVRLLRFDDELCDQGRPYPSDGSWRQALKDCDTYEAYWHTHPDFVNGIGEDAVDSIRSKYRYCKDRSLFGKAKG